LPSVLFAEQKLSVYFLNDSINGLKVSDAYETHNMGLRFDIEDKFITLDLGIVSPDMHIYKNQYRVANRSFGELVTLSMGQKIAISESLELSYHGEIKSSGSFGLDKMQDFMHRLLTLQPVNSVNDLVRMPDKTWIGFGINGSYDLGEKFTFFDRLGLNSYLGQDKIEISPYVFGSLNQNAYILTNEIGLRAIFHDEIVSAPPIEAEHRNVIPYIEFGIIFDLFDAKWFIKDRFSLPSIENDNKLYGVLNVGLSIEL